MTGTSRPQESPGPLPAATPCSVPQQQEPSTEYVPGGHPGTTSRHPSLAGAALDQDRVAMPPPPPLSAAARGRGSLRRRGTEGALRHPRFHALERAGGNRLGTPP